MLSLAMTLAIFAAALVISAVKILNEYERGVVLTLGRYTSTKGPGLIILIPVVQKIIKVDLRTIVMDVPPQDVISRDNVSVKVNAVVYFRVVDPSRSILQVANYYEAISQLSQTTLRSVLGQHELDEMLTEREKLNTDLQTILDEQSDPRHGAPGRGRAFAPCQGDPRRGRDAGGGEAARGRRTALAGAAGAAAALHADADRHRRREEFHHRLPAAHGPDQSLPRQAAQGLRPHAGVIVASSARHGAGLV
jgi:hypothetical protein